MLKEFHDIKWGEKNLLAFDVDNTVCDSCQVIDESFAKDFTRTDRTLVFISGTDVNELKRMVADSILAIDPSKEIYLAGGSGSHIVKITSEGVQQLYKRALSATAKLAVLYALGRAIKEFGLEVTESQILDRGSQITLSCLGRYADSEVKEKWDPHQALRKSIVRFLRSHLSVEQYTIKIGGTTSIDVSEGEWDKEDGMRKILQLLDTTPECAAFFGDSVGEDGNDYPATLVVDSVRVFNPTFTRNLLVKIF